MWLREAVIQTKHHPWQVQEQSSEQVQQSKLQVDQKHQLARPDHEQLNQHLSLQPRSIHWDHEQSGVALLREDDSHLLQQIRRKCGN